MRHSITGASTAIREVLAAQRVGSPQAEFMATVAEALAALHARGASGAEP